MRTKTAVQQASMRRLGIGVGVAAVVVASLAGGSVALGGEPSGRAGDAGAVQPAAGVQEAAPATTSAVPAATETSAAAAAATTEDARRTATTRAPQQARAPRPVYVDGVPQVKATPTSATVGARIRIEGHGFTSEQWRAPGAALWLAHIGGCGMYAEADHKVRVTAGGHLTGELTVPAKGSCRQSGTGDQPVVAGQYRIAFSCTACFIGQLTVTAPPAAGTPCRNVGFTPNSDDVASSIVARNLPCADAEALVRKVGRPLGYNGPATAAADGFRCVRTGREDRVLPVAFYECNKGSRRVTFART